METVFYYDKMTKVQLGDEVEKKILFSRSGGRVVYVPGISPKHDEFEHNGLCYVGIKLFDGRFVATVVDPKEWYIQKK